MVAEVDKSGIDAADISNLVHAFYPRVRADPRLGLIFERQIGTCDREWEPHLARIECGSACKIDPHLGVIGVQK